MAGAVAGMEAEGADALAVTLLATVTLDATTVEAPFAAAATTFSAEEPCCN
jgi:hypothetical protein